MGEDDIPNTAQYPPPIKTYILAGYDGGTAFEDIPHTYKNGPTTQIITHKPGVSIRDALKEIKPPANIVIAAHGSEDGRVEWNAGELVTYSDIFKALPHMGVGTIVTMSCFGGKAEEMLKDAPHGAVVLSFTSDKTASAVQFANDFATETRGMTKPADLFLKILDNIDPNEAHRVIEDFNRKMGYHLDSNPHDVLPHFVGIGGIRPDAIDLNTTVHTIESQSQNHSLNETAWKATLNRVQGRFDVNDPGVSNEWIMLHQWPILVPATQKFNDLVNGNEKKQHEEHMKSLLDALQSKIGQVAQKMHEGKPLQDPDEQRISYALAFAYLEATGELENRIKAAQDIAVKTQTQNTPSLQEPTLAMLYHISEKLAPHIYQKQVGALQQKLIAAGEDIGHPDKILGPKMLHGIEDIAAQAHVDAHNIDFTDASNSEHKKFDKALQKAINHHKLQQSHTGTLPILQQNELDGGLNQMVSGCCDVAVSQKPSPTPGNGARSSPAVEPLK